MKIKTLNTFLLIIVSYFLLGYFLIRLQWDFVLFQVLWELTFIPLMIAGTVISVVAIVTAIKIFERSAVQVLALVLSIGFITYFFVLLVSIASTKNLSSNEFNF